MNGNINATSEASVCFKIKFKGNKLRFSFAIHYLLEHNSKEVCNATLDLKQNKSLKQVLI